MGKLMKYELRKSLFSKVFLLAITGLIELLFLIGVFAEKENLTAIGILLLVLAASFGIPLVARLPIDPAIAALVDAGEIESVPADALKALVDAAEGKSDA